MNPPGRFKNSYSNNILFLTGFDKSKLLKFSMACMVQKLLVGRECKENPFRETGKLSELVRTSERASF